MNKGLNYSEDPFFESCTFIFGKTDGIKPNMNAVTTKVKKVNLLAVKKFACEIITYHAIIVT